jgi:hypothetical protein
VTFRLIIVRHLEATDFDECRSRQAAMRTIRQLEDQSAHVLGLAAVFAQV